jgi:hypothetical protein
MGLLRPAGPGKCMAISPLNVFRLTPKHDLQTELPWAGILIVLVGLYPVPWLDGNELPPRKEEPETRNAFFNPTVRALWFPTG